MSPLSAAVNAARAARARMERQGRQPGRRHALAPASPLGTPGTAGPAFKPLPLWMRGSVDEEDWVVVARHPSLVLVETPTTLRASPTWRRYSDSEERAHSLHFCDPSATLQALTEAVFEAEDSSRWVLLQAAEAEWRNLLHSTAIPDVVAMVKAWEAAEMDLIIEEHAARLELQTELLRDLDFCTRIGHCSLQEGVQRYSIAEEAEMELGNLVDNLNWEVLTYDTVRFCVQWEEMLVQMISVITALEARQRCALEQEQRHMRHELRKEREQHRRFQVMKRRYPNAPEVLGTETPMHAFLRNFRFPAVDDGDASSGESLDVGPPQRLREVWDDVSTASQCMTPEVGTPDSTNRGAMFAAC